MNKEYFQDYLIKALDLKMSAIQNCREQISFVPKKLKRNIKIRILLHNLLKFCLKWFQIYIYTMTLKIFINLITTLKMFINFIGNIFYRENVTS
jgi:hypothetical protein